MTRHSIARTSLTLTALLYVFTGGAPAALTTFYANDPSAGLGPSPHPNSDAMAANFDAAASSLGSLQRINLEALPLGNFSSLNISPGVTATLIGTDPQGGINNSQNLFFGTDPNSVGYNTTPGGQQFLAVVPTYGTVMARLTLDFSPSIQAFGTYLTGLGHLSGPLFLLFDDGTSQTLQFTGPASGSAANFIGFTDPGKQISEINFELRNINATSRDIYSVDDLRFVLAVPEPLTVWFTLHVLCVVAPFRRPRHRIN